MKPKLLDLFCGAGGASMGYHRAGFDVIGVDVKRQKRYPFKFIQADARDVLRDHDFTKSFDAIHASPPCQMFSNASNLAKGQDNYVSKVNMIPLAREGLMMTARPWIIENVPGAPLEKPITLCGSYFKIGVRRHRLFESGEFSIKGVECDHKSQPKIVGVYGKLRDKIPGGGKTADSIEEAREAMGIDWMIWTEIVEAIPPVYTEYLGKQLIEVV